MVQADPFHPSINVVLLSEAKSSAYPTAQTWLDEMASASSNEKKSAPGQVGFGVGTIDHLVPFQFRARVSRPVAVGGRPELYRTTAQMSSEPMTTSAPRLGGCVPPVSVFPQPPPREKLSPVRV